MVRLKAAEEAAWEEPVKGLRVKVRPLSTSVLLEAERVRSRLVKADPVASHRLPGVDSDEEDGDAAPAEPDTAIDPELILARRIYLMAVAYVVAGVEAWEGVEDVDGTPLTQPKPEKVRALLDQNPAIFGHFDRGYVEKAYRLAQEKNGLPPSPDTSGAREVTRGAKTPAKAGTAAETPSPAP